MLLVATPTSWLVMTIMVAVVFLALLTWVLRSGRSGEEGSSADPRSVVGVLLLLAGVGLGLHALAEARGDLRAEPFVSSVLAVGALISGALLVSRRSPA